MGKRLKKKLVELMYPKNEIKWRYDIKICFWSSNFNVCYYYVVFSSYGIYQRHAMIFYSRDIILQLRDLGSLHYFLSLINVLFIIDKSQILPLKYQYQMSAVHSWW